MKPIKQYQEILQGIKYVKDFKENYFTNFFPDKTKIELWIDLQIIFKTELVDGVVLYLKKNKDFWNLYFFAKSLNSLNNAIINFNKQYSEKISLDIVGSKQQTEPFIDIFHKNNFKLYKKLVRMSRKVTAFDENVDKNITFAKKNNNFEIKELLSDYFDPLSEQLPYIQEIDKWIENKRVITYSENNKIIGFVIFDLFGMKSYLRYWFVHPEHRDKKIGAKLLRKFFKLCESSKLQIFWVIDDNINAIKRYEHYGFTTNEMYNFVMLKQ